MEWVMFGTFWLLMFGISFPVAIDVADTNDRKWKAFLVYLIFFMFAPVSAGATITKIMRDV